MFSYRHIAHKCSIRIELDSSGTVSLSDPYCCTQVQTFYQISHFVRLLIMTDRGTSPLCIEPPLETYKLQFVSLVDSEVSHSLQAQWLDLLDRTILTRHILHVHNINSLQVLLFLFSTKR